MASSYQVGWICAVRTEYVAACELLDEEFQTPPLPHHDDNAYTCGRIGDHKLVVACLPQGKYGLASAATVAKDLLRSFPAIHFGLMVGIGGGAPSAKHDIRLGDVVVSSPTGRAGGVIHYEFGKTIQDKKFERTGSLTPPPPFFLTALQKLTALHERRGHGIAETVNQMVINNARLKRYQHPDPRSDLLYKSTFVHPDEEQPCGEICGIGDDRIVQRPARDPDQDDPVIHYGLIASADRLMNDAHVRDHLAQTEGVLCFEREAAGLVDNFRCLVIRGICDYSDTHTNDLWQGYAAATAAAYAKELLSMVTQKELTIEVARSRFRLGLHLNDAPTVDSRLFIGRESELAKMEAILKPNDLSVEQRRLVLGGMGGIGKTQLAIAYAERHRHSYESIFWLNATSSKTLQASLHQLAQHVLSPDELKHCGDDQLMVHVSRWLSDPDNTRWLLIFDNYDDPDQYQITKYYPYASQGSIIVTTRLSDLVGGLPIKVQHLDRLEDSLQILETRSERQSVKSVQDADARRLAERLHGLPLALATAGAFLKRNTLSFKQYLDAYEERWDITPTRHTNLPEYETRTLYTTWDLSFRRLKQEDPEAAQLLSLLAYFDNQNIWYEILHAGVSRVSAEWLAASTANVVAFASTMGKLVEYCFVENNGGTNSYSMHTCIHDWTLHGLNREVDVDKYWFAFDCVTASIANEGSDDFLGLRFQRLAAHGARLVNDRFQEAGNLDNAFDQRIEGTLYIAEMLTQQIQHDAAEKMYRRALQGCEHALGPEHPSTLLTVNNLGSLYRDQGKLDQAEAMFGRALQGYEKTLGPEHTSTILTVNNLGLLYRDLGKLDQAEAMFGRALQGCEDALGPEHPSTLLTANNLGLLYRDQGKLDQAEAMFGRALQGCEHALGPEHTSTLLTVNNLGALYRDLGKLDQAEAMYRRAVQGYEKALGPEHTSTILTVNNLGLLYRDLGKLDQAEAMFGRALQGYEKALGPEHTSTITAVNNLGFLYRDLGKLDQAEAMIRRALQGNEKALGPEHTSTLLTVNNLGLLYQDQGKLDQAEAMIRRALQGNEKALGPEHASTLLTVNNLGLLYQDLGKLDQAEAMYRRALQGNEKALGPEHTSTLLTANNLGFLYRDQGKLDQAEVMLRRALQGYDKALGPEHTSTILTVNNLGLLYQNQGKLDQAEAMFGRALQGYEKAMGPEHTSTLLTVNNLGLLYRDQGKLDQAEAMFGRALQGYEKALGPEHTSTLLTVNNLGLLYRDQGKLDQAEVMLRRALQGYEKALGPEHTSTILTVNNLGLLYSDHGKLDQAEAMLRRALQGYDKALGPEHTSTLLTVNNLGLLYRDQGKLDQAEVMLQRALQGYEKALGPEHPETLVIANNLGTLYSDQGKLDQAEAMLRRALRGQEKVLGPGHPNTLLTVGNLRNLGTVSTNQGPVQSIYSFLKANVFRLLKL